MYLSGSDSLLSEPFASSIGPSLKPQVLTLSKSLQFQGCAVSSIINGWQGGGGGGGRGGRRGGQSRGRQRQRGGWCREGADEEDICGSGFQVVDADSSCWGLHGGITLILLFLQKHTHWDERGERGGLRVNIIYPHREAQWSPHWKNCSSNKVYLLSRQKCLCLTALALRQQFST